MAKHTLTPPTRTALLIVPLLLLSIPYRLEQPSSGSRMDSIPQLVLWAWERPEDLTFIDAQREAIAFLSGTIRFHAGDVSIRPRFQPVRVADGAKLIAVTRIEADSDAALNRVQLEDSVAAILKSSSLPRVAAVQVDFDATRSQRRFYRDLLVELRRRLRPGVPISITALASWCLNSGDDWISGLPIDEAVPMLFRMGVGTRDTVAKLTSGRDFRPAACRGSFGVSTDEPWASLPRGRRIYIFHPAPWSVQTEATALKEVHQWR
jgi:hypothetical protein